MIRVEPADGQHCVPAWNCPLRRRRPVLRVRQIMRVSARTSQDWTHGKLEFGVVGGQRSLRRRRRRRRRQLGTGCLPGTSLAREGRGTGTLPALGRTSRRERVHSLFWSCSRQVLCIAGTLNETYSMVRANCFFIRENQAPLLTHRVPSHKNVLSLIQ